LEKAFSKSQKGHSKYDREALEFAMDEVYNLLQLQKEIKDETYEFSGYTTFTISEPKERVINAPHYKDKIIQLAVNRVLKEIYKPHYIYDTYACIDGKGTHACVKRIQYFMRKAKWNYGDGAYIVKIDIEKFFYTIVREILKTLLTKKIKCKKTLQLLYKIIDSARLIDVLGLPLGNTLSQLCANICLDVVDQYAKRGLGLKYYVRYMDDITIFVESKERAKEVLELIRGCVESRLHLKLNSSKSKIFPISQGVNTIGFKIYPTHMLLRNDSKKRIKRKAKKMKRLLINKEMTIETAEQILNSWHGHAKQCCSYNFIQSLLRKNDYIYMNKKGVLKVNKNKLYRKDETNAV